MPKATVRAVPAPAAQPCLQRDAGSLCAVTSRPLPASSFSPKV